MMVSMRKIAAHARLPSPKRSSSKRDLSPKKTRSSWTRGTERQNSQSSITSLSSTGTTGGFLENARRAELIKKYWAHWNSHHVQGCQGMLTDDFVIVLPDGCEMSWDDFASEMQGVFDSFPDCQFQYQKTEVTNEGMVKVHNLTMKGTHTGEPYAYACYEPIEASGDKVLNDPEDLSFHFTADDKIRKIVVLASSQQNFWSQIYSQLGGAFPLM